MLLPLADHKEGLCGGKVGTIPKEFHIVFYIAYVH